MSEGRAEGCEAHKDLFFLLIANTYLQVCITIALPLHATRQLVTLSPCHPTPTYKVQCKHRQQFRNHFIATPQNIIHNPIHIHLQALDRIVPNSRRIFSCPVSLSAAVQKRALYFTSPPCASTSPCIIPRLAILDSPCAINRNSRRSIFTFMDTA